MSQTTPTPRRVTEAGPVHDEREIEAVVDVLRTTRLDLGEPVPPLAIWFVADLGSGSHVMSATPGYEPPRLTLTNALKNDSAGQVKKLEWPFAEMEIVLVRPGVGAWDVYAAKYSGMDENAANQQPLRIDVSRLAAVGNSGQAPNNFRPGDVVALIDTRWMQYGVIEVGR